MPYGIYQQSKITSTLLSIVLVKNLSNCPVHGTFIVPYLTNYCLHTAQRNTLVVGTDNKFEQVVTEYFKHHAYICSTSRLYPLQRHSNITQYSKINCLPLKHVFFTFKQVMCQTVRGHKQDSSCEWQEILQDYIANFVPLTAVKEF